jgi:hypothetical protein
LQIEPVKSAKIRVPAGQHIDRTKKWQFAPERCRKTGKRSKIHDSSGKKVMFCGGTAKVKDDADT